MGNFKQTPDGLADDLVVPLSYNFDFFVYSVFSIQPTQKYFRCPKCQGDNEQLLREKSYVQIISWDYPFIDSDNCLAPLSEEENV